MTNERKPKQRVLVRWNDDLDKSLLLFITHTCTELGIKIPYDEVARRMGSTFTEGAIQQHISKLRNKMADMNTAPVPAPAKRGNITTRPSSVYSQKQRTRPPLQLPASKKARSQTVGRTTQLDGDELFHGRHTTAQSRRTSRQFKRSDSDYGQTDDEFAGASDGDFVGPSNTGNKRKRGGRGSGGRATTKRTRNNANALPNGPSHPSHTHNILSGLRAADDQHDAELGHGYDDDLIHGVHTSVEQADPAFGIQDSYIGFGGVPFDRNNDDDKGFEDSSNPGQTQSSYHFGNYATQGTMFSDQSAFNLAGHVSNLGMSQGDQLSPVSPGSIVPSMSGASTQAPMTALSTPTISSGYGTSMLSSAPSALQYRRQYAPNTYDNFDFSGGADHSTMPPPPTPTRPASINYGPPAWPPAAESSMPQATLPSPNHSTLSSFSSQGGQSAPNGSHNWAGTLQIPVENDNQGSGNDGSMSSSSQNSSLAANKDGSAEHQGQTNKFDIDWSQFPDLLMNEIANIAGSQTGTGNDFSQWTDI